MINYDGRRDAVAVVCKDGSILPGYHRSATLQVSRD